MNDNTEKRSKRERRNRRNKREKSVMDWLIGSLKSVDGRLSDRRKKERRDAR
jgi:hypothetical protein